MPRSDPRRPSRTVSVSAMTAPQFRVEVARKTSPSWARPHGAELPPVSSLLRCGGLSALVRKYGNVLPPVVVSMSNHEWRVALRQAQGER